MPHVFLPPFTQSLANDLKEVDVAGTTVQEVICHLEEKYPGIQKRLCDAGNLKPGLTVVVNETIRTKGLREKVQREDEIHFLPTIGGG
ncbi:hypothetical protein MNBD_PLANCTO02-151 [hydrothermal vent metagenome]|uniref:Molybdopterin synthase sulfur carrier subunit n=1 Tax=hydrothermal vent metagenome TaxID=652676 RepID=A0A3B1DNU1_9ZZZZ